VIKIEFDKLAMVISLKFITVSVHLC